MKNHAAVQLAYIKANQNKGKIKQSKSIDMMYSDWNNDVKK